MSKRQLGSPSHGAPVLPPQDRRHADRLGLPRPRRAPRRQRVLPDRFPTAFGQARFLFLVLKRADELTDLQPGVLELLLLSPLMHSDPAAEWVRSVHSDSKRRMHSEHALKRGPRPTGHGFSGRMPARSWSGEIGSSAPGRWPKSSSTERLNQGSRAPDAGALARPDRLSSLFPHRGRSWRGEMDDR
jgi:hypothetical protein